MPVRAVRASDATTCVDCSQPIRFEYDNHCPHQIELYAEFLRSSVAQTMSAEQTSDISLRDVSSAFLVLGYHLLFIVFLPAFADHERNESGQGCFSPMLSLQALFP